ncbi:unnamed protein product, partial [Dicrocoelium dendriticum]
MLWLLQGIINGVRTAASIRVDMDLDATAQDFPSSYSSSYAFCPLWSRSSFTFILPVFNFPILGPPTPCVANFNLHVNAERHSCPLVKPTSNKRPSPDFHLEPSIILCS